MGGVDGGELDPADPAEPAEPAEPGPAEQALAEQALAVLRAAGVRIEAGLTEAELAGVEARFGFRFCRTHKAFLQLGLPVGDGWPEWRPGSTAELIERLSAPIDGLLFDIEYNEFWPAPWGPRPLDDVLAVAQENLDGVPRLVPLYRHRYLPAEPAPEPTPVLSVVQADVLVYGTDLLDYVRVEFAGRPRGSTSGRTVPFWSEL